MSLYAGMVGGVSCELYDSDEEESKLRAEEKRQRTLATKTREDFESDEQWTAFLRKRTAIEKYVCVCVDVYMCAFLCVYVCVWRNHLSMLVHYNETITR